MSPTSAGGGDEGGHRPDIHDLSELQAVLDALGDDLSGYSDEAVRQLLVRVHRLGSCLDGLAAAAARVFDRRKLQASDAARTTATWVAARCEVTRTEAAHSVALGEAMEHMPVMAAALRAGTIGVRKARALAEIRTPELAELIAAEEEFLVASITDMGVLAADRWLRGWQQQARLMVGFIDPDDPVDTHEPRITATLARTFQDRWVLDVEMDGEHGRTLASIIDTEIDEMFRTGAFRSDDGLSRAHRRGQALFNVVTRKALRKWRHGAPVPSVEVICDERTLKGIPIQGEEDLRTRVARYSDGEPLSLATLGRYLCGARIHRLVINAKGEVLDAGKTIHVHHPTPHPEGAASPHPPHSETAANAAPSRSATPATAPSPAATPPSTGPRSRAARRGDPASTGTTSEAQPRTTAHTRSGRSPATVQPTTSRAGTPTPTTPEAAPTSPSSSPSAATTTTRSTKAASSSSSNPTAPSLPTDPPTRSPDNDNASPPHAPPTPTSDPTPPERGARIRGRRAGPSGPGRRPSRRACASARPSDRGGGRRG